MAARIGRSGAHSPVTCPSVQVTPCQEAEHGAPLSQPLALAHFAPPAESYSAANNGPGGGQMMPRFEAQFGKRGGTGHANSLVLAVGQFQLASHWALVKVQ